MVKRILIFLSKSLAPCTVSPREKSASEPHDFSLIRRPFYYVSNYDVRRLCPLASFAKLISVRERMKGDHERLDWQQCFTLGLASAHCLAMLANSVTPSPHIIFSIVTSLCSLNPSLASYEVCEVADGDCPTSCEEAGYAGNNNFNAHLQIAPFHPSIEKKAWEAEKTIKKSGDVKSVDSPVWKLHTTLYYFCCYTDEEEKKIKAGLKNMDWEPFSVKYDNTGCNVDQHSDDLVYLHAMPKDQSALFDFARRIEGVMSELDVHVEPRETLFHMTLARVGKDYPVDDVISDLGGFEYGELVVEGFQIGSLHYSPKN